MASFSNQPVREVSRSFWEKHHSSREFQYISDSIFQTRGIGAGYDAQFSCGDPFQIRNLHMAFIRRGYIDNTVNLFPHRYEEGQLMVVTSGSILTQRAKSDDFDMQVLQFGLDYISGIFRGSVPPMFSHRMSEFTLTPSESDASVYENLTASLWGLLHSETHVQTAIDSCCVAILQFVRELIICRTEIQKVERSRNLTIFNRFISLVNEHCEAHRDMPFYAENIGVTKQHLSTVITAASGRTASSWIEDALLSRAKVLLRHSDLTVSEVSEQLNFPAPPHFTRFFKRLTGVTPQGFRQGRDGL